MIAQHKEAVRFLLPPIRPGVFHMQTACFICRLNELSDKFIRILSKTFNLSLKVCFQQFIFLQLKLEFSVK